MRFTLKQKLFLLSAIVTSGIVILSAVLLFQLNKVFEKTNFAIVNTFGSDLLLQDIRVLYTKNRSYLRLYVLTQEAQRQNEIRQKVKRNQQQVLDLLKKYDTDGCLNATRCVADDRDMSNMVTVRTIWEDIGQYVDKEFDEARSDKTALNEYAPGNVLLAKLDKFEHALTEMITYNVQLGKTVSADAQRFKDDANLISGILSLALLLTVSTFAYLISRSIMRTLGGDPQVVSDIVREVAKGDLRISQSLENPGPESLLGSVRALVVNLANLASQTDQIGKGDFSRRVSVLSEHDRLSQSINNMTLLLQQTRDEDEKRNWMKDGSNELSQALTGDFAIQELADISISVLARYLNAGRGVLYVCRKEGMLLELTGSYMYTERQHLGASVRPGEGAVGQVAREKKAIILTTIQMENAPITTGTTNGTPLYTYTYPLLRNNTLHGVLELASYERFDDSAVDLLKNGCDVIASFLYIAEQRESIKTLLDKTIAAEQSAREQSENLQAANTLMEEQQQQLQQQSEELRQANAQMEEQQQILEQKNQVLKSSKAELDAKARDLENAGRYKSEFLANMSHELRTPLNAIILLSKMMAANQENLLRPEDVKRAEVILRSGKDLLALINDVLDLSKIEAGRMDTSYSEIFSQAFCSYFHDLFNPQAEEKHLSFIIDDQIGGKFVSDSDKLSQVLRNLLSNAFKFTRKGQVTLRLFRRPEEHLSICIQVSDSGVGIPKDKQALIFEAFRQADGSTSREFGGTGLGLTISLSIARLLGGTIDVSSGAEQGSTFTVRLPATPAGWSPRQVSSAASLMTMEVSDDRQHLQEGDKLILLIDDDSAFGAALLEINRRLGYKTLIAGTGKLGIELARQYHPSGILLDLGLPDIDGTRVLEELKSSQDLAQIPIYIVSARDHHEGRHLSRSSIGYLQKPASESQLIEAEAALLSHISNVPDKPQRVLVIGAQAMNAAQVQKLLAGTLQVCQQDIQDVAATDNPEQKLQEGSWQLVIIDLSAVTTVEGKRLAGLVRQYQPDASMIFFSLTPLSEQDEAMLRPYSDSIIIHNAHAESRLINNLERFLNSVQSRPQQRPEAPGKLAGAGKQLAGHHILVVDDDPRNLFAVTAALEQQGAKVTCATNGKLALGMLEKEGYDMVFMDIMMPEMDGFQVIQAIRAQTTTRMIPIVALTAKALPQDREKILQAGASDYLSKPVDFNDLIQMAEKWIFGKA